MYAGFESVRDPGLKARCFLLAYAAATALFESSGRLVVTFQDWEAARRKLNEPDPRWGISAGMFDRIAAGIGAGDNAERFEEMAAYFEARRPLWREEKVWLPEEMDWLEKRIVRGIEATRGMDVHAHRNWLKRVMADKPAVIDLRNIYPPGDLVQRGFIYESIGRPRSNGR